MEKTSGNTAREEAEEVIESLKKDGYWGKQE